MKKVKYKDTLILYAKSDGLSIKIDAQGLITCGGATADGGVANGGGGGGATPAKEGPGLDAWDSDMLSEEYHPAATEGD